MIKCWQDNCKADSLKSFMIERLAQDFLLTWQWHQKGAFFYDWMVRDFFAYPHPRNCAYSLRFALHTKGYAKITFAHPLRHSS